LNVVTLYADVPAFVVGPPKEVPLPLQLLKGFDLNFATLEEDFFVRFFPVVLTDFTMKVVL
jgi:hypothetical protein